MLEKFIHSLESYSQSVKFCISYRLIVQVLLCCPYHEDKDKNLAFGLKPLRKAGVQQCGDRLDVFRVLLSRTTVAFYMGYTFLHITHNALGLDRPHCCIPA